MLELYHFPLCQFSRIVRIALQEKNLSCELIVENYWERNREFARLNSAMEVPVLMKDENPIADINAIVEFLEEEYHEHSLFAENSLENAEIRRIFGWFNNKFFHEVNKHIINEKIIRFYLESGTPDSISIRAARANLAYHLKYIDHLLNKRTWLAGDKFSYADIAASSALSVLDYLGDINWDQHEQVKQWYSVIKSRPSFRTILTDKIYGFLPAKHYKDLDF